MRRFRLRRIQHHAKYIHRAVGRRLRRRHQQLGGSRRDRSVQFGASPLRHRPGNLGHRSRQQRHQAHRRQQLVFPRYRNRVYRGDETHRAAERDAAVQFHGRHQRICPHFTDGISRRRRDRRDDHERRPGHDDQHRFRPVQSEHPRDRRFRRHQQRRLFHERRRDVDRIRRASQWRDRRHSSNERRWFGGPLGAVQWHAVLFDEQRRSMDRGHDAKRNAHRRHRRLGSCQSQ